MNYKSFDNLSEDIKKNLHRLHEFNFDLIVGIPRSGMIPAYMISLYLNVDVTDFPSLVSNQIIKKGRTRSSKHSLKYPGDAHNILLVDDSILSGKSLTETLSEIPANLIKKIKTLAIYSDKPKRNDVDMFFEYVESPRVFEWNIFHRSLLGKSCLDIDGVLCVDPTDEQNDDGCKYEEFIMNAKPHILPSYKVHSLVTNRLEKYRNQTETWLRKHGVEYSHLIMLDLPSKQERQIQGAHVSHKVNYYAKHGSLEMFIESNAYQAEKIMLATRKPVYCVDENIMFNPSSSSLMLLSPKSYLRKAKYK